MTDVPARRARLRDELAARLAAVRARGTAAEGARTARAGDIDVSKRRGLIDRAATAAAAARARLTARTADARTPTARPAAATTARIDALRMEALRTEALRMEALRGDARAAAERATRALASRGATTAGARSGGGGARIVAGVLTGALLVWLFGDACADDPAPVATVAAPTCPTCAEAPLCVPPVRVARPTPARRVKAKIPPTPREALDVGERAPPPWLEAFRRQVMARSTILAACFAGTERPGAAWWTARFDPASGIAADGRLEAVEGGPPLLAAQSLCVLRGLQDSRYALGAAADADPAARRLRLLIEF
jgi:hypothetical protein